MFGFPPEVRLQRHAAFTPMAARTLTRCIAVAILYALISTRHRSLNPCIGIVCKYARFGHRLVLVLALRSTRVKLDCRHTDQALLWLLLLLLTGWVPSPQLLNDILAGKRVEVKVGEGAFWRTFGGDQSPEDLETALQLVYRLFTSTVVPDPVKLATCLRCICRSLSA